MDGETILIQIHLESPVVLITNRIQTFTIGLVIRSSVI